MTKISAGILVYRKIADEIEVLLVHPGGPYFQSKDDGVWSIPKGELDKEDDLVAAAVREFEEETGLKLPKDARLVPLGSVENSTRKVVHVFAVEVDFDLNRPVLSNFFEIEWPPNSGKMQQFPEVDKFGYYSLAEARQKLTPYQVPMVDRLLSIQQSEGSGTF